VPRDVLIFAVKTKRERVEKREVKLTLSSMIGEYEYRLQHSLIFNSKTGRRLASASVTTLLETCRLFRKYLESDGVNMDFDKYNIESMGYYGKSQVHSVYEKFTGTFKSFLIDRGLSEYTIFKTVYKMKQMIRYFCEKESVELGSLLNDLKFQKVQREVEVISEEQINFILSNYHRMVRDCLTEEQKNTVDYMVIGILMAARRSDMDNWDKANLYENGGATYLKFKPQKTTNSSGVIVDVPVPPMALSIFKANLKKHSKLMPPLSQSINKRLKAITRRYDIFHNEVQIYRKGRYVKVRQCDAIHIHQLRASGTSHRLMQKMPEAAVRDMTGHTHDSEAFARYIKVSREAKAKFADEYLGTLPPEVSVPLTEE
jgi:hypothetical protein